MSSGHTFAEALRGRYAATSRSSFVSRARYTSPMPPSPILAVTAYGPRVVPGWRAISIQAVESRGSARSVAGLGATVLFDDTRRVERPKPDTNVVPESQSHVIVRL